MNDGPSRDEGFAKESAAAIGAIVLAILAIGCCVGLPLIAAVAGSVVIGTLLGVGGAVLGAVVLIGVTVAVVRSRRRVCEPRSATRPRGTLSASDAERPNG